ncbi:hypothetical protein DMH17_00510 [Raoultella planticola]|nr:hypothetical protein [Raoultella planticola]
MLPWQQDTGWPTRVIPLQIGVLQFPVPSARRCYKLRLRRAIESYPQDINVAIVATGACRIRFMASAVVSTIRRDAQFVDMLVNDPEKLAEMTLGEYATLGDGRV